MDLVRGALTPLPPPPRMSCPRCGAPIKSLSAGICVRCGFPLGEDYRPE
jgi:predicted amidophosphoribosyltransferase